MILLGSTKNKITKDENGEKVPQDSRVLYTFVPNKSFGSLRDISPSNHILLKIFNSEYDKIALWLTNQNSQPLEIEDRINCN